MSQQRMNVHGQRGETHNPQYVLSLSYGKDSLACIGAINELGWPLDRILHCEIWATREINADLPPMVQFKEKADEIIYRPPRRMRSNSIQNSGSPAASDTVKSMDGQ